MGRPKGEKTTHIRIRKSLISGLRIQFPSIKSDDDRIATCFDYYKNVQGTIDNVGGFIYGNKWKKTIKK